MIYIDFSETFTASSIHPSNEFEESIRDFLSEWENNSPTILAHTSGSTGTPKPILLQKKDMRKSAQMTAKYLGLKRGDTALLVMPMSYIAGKLMVVRALEVGLKLICMQPTSSISLKQINQDLGLALTCIDFVALTPMQVEKSIGFVGSIKKLIIGGAPLSQVIKEKLYNYTNSVYETYAMTETITHIAFKQVANKCFPDVNDHFEVFDEIKITQDQRGCLVIYTPYELSPVITNDVVTLTSPESFQWVGRADNVINSGGIKLFPEQIEEILKAHIPRSFFVSSLADEQLGQKLVLVIEGDEYDIDLSSASLSRYQQPKEIFFVPTFPRTESGKIQRTQIVFKQH